MTQQDYRHPIAPPPELVQQWYDQAKQDPCGPINWVSVRAAQWGADQELEACCEWLVSEGWFRYEHEAVQDLRAARRPKPPSLKEQALTVLDDANLDAAHENILRRALEQLND
jgi:hypothetical protein